MNNKIIPSVFFALLVSLPTLAGYESVLPFLRPPAIDMPIYIVDADGQVRPAPQEFPHQGVEDGEELQHGGNIFRMFLESVAGVLSKYFYLQE